MRLQEFLFAEILRRNHDATRVRFGFSNEVNYRILRDGIKEGRSYEDVLAKTPAAKMMARFGFIFTPAVDPEKAKDDQEFCLFTYVRSPRIPH